MKKFVIIIAVLFGLAGCSGEDNAAPQSSAWTPPQEMTDTAAQAEGSTEEERRVAASRLLINRGFEALKNSDPVSAIENFQNAIKVNPGDPAGYLVLAQVYIRMEQADRAEALLTRTAQVFPENGEVFFFLSLASSQNGKPEQAIQAVKQSIIIFKNQNNEDALERAAGLYQQLVSSLEGSETDTPTAAQ